MRTAATCPRHRAPRASHGATGACWAALSLFGVSCALFSSTGINVALVDAFSVPPSSFVIGARRNVGFRLSDNAMPAAFLQLYPDAAPRKEASSDPVKWYRYVPKKMSPTGTVTATEYTDAPAGISKPSWRFRMAQNLIEKRQRRRRRLRSFVQRFVGAVGLSLALWQMAVVTGGSLNRSAEVQNQSPLTCQGMSDEIMPPDGETMVFNSNSLARNVVVATSRGGGRRGKSVASSAPISAGERIRNKIVQLGSQSKSLAQDGVDRAVNIYQTADPNKKVAAGIIGAAAVGVGIGVEVAGRGSNDEDDGEALSNTDKLRKDIMNEIDWYNERYGTKQATRASGPPDGSAELEGASEMSEIRKIDPQEQVKAILDNAKETERRARQARREGPGSITSPPSAASSGVDYSQVKGLSTKEGDGKSRAQLLIETTARMEQRAEAQRLENTRQRDFAGEDFVFTIMSFVGCCPDYMIRLTNIVSFAPLF